MGKIVAIGGGENGHHNTKYETGPFDKEIIKLTGKTSPNFLFIGLANSYPNYYFEVMDKIYNGMYGCRTDYLRYEDIKNQNVASSKIKKAEWKIWTNKATVILCNWIIGIKYWHSLNFVL